MDFQARDIPVQVAVTIDCNDLDKMARFWSELLGVDLQIEEEFAFLSPSPGRTGTIWLQRVPERSDEKNRLHLDLVVPDLPAAERRIETLGGSVQDMHHWREFEWRTCTDPEGNVFDVMAAPAES